MKFLRSRDVRNLEEKNMMEAQHQRIQKRLSLEGGLSVKESLIMMLKGIFFGVILTAFEYAIKNPEVEGTLGIIFRIGFFVSAIGVLQFPYGLYNFIKGVKLSSKNNRKEEK
ncbi:MAG: hypothetical protein JJT76_11600 [Clostridiaceae bacterium]|nr:hypothetical protein [Clostridiaceae bacterium]